MPLLAVVAVVAAAEQVEAAVAVSNNPTDGAPKNPFYSTIHGLVLETLM